MASDPGLLNYVPIIPLTVSTMIWANLFKQQKANPAPSFFPQLMGKGKESIEGIGKLPLTPSQVTSTL